nr:helix-turn-helix domain-containing protein [Cyanobium sp. LEGE 06113]
MVTQRLREMEEAGLIIREVVSDRPIAVQYSITDFGKTALGVLDALKDWAEKHQL